MFLQDISASGFVEVSGNNLAGEAGLDDFTLSLKWSKVGNFHMYLVQVWFVDFLLKLDILSGSLLFSLYFFFVAYSLFAMYIINFISFYMNKI